MKILITFLLACILFSNLTTAQTQDTIAKRYIKVKGGYLMVLKPGDSILTHLKSLAIAEKIPAAGFTGLGFAGYVKFGYFNAQTRQYEPAELRDVELASFTGSIAWENGQPAIHAHGVVAGKDFISMAGHILTASVGTGTLEIMITAYDQKLERKKDAATGASAISFE